LQAAGLPVKVLPLATVSEQDLRSSNNALFVVSTFGDGEAPDSARGFERKVLGRASSLESLNYAVLGLGDRQYQHFCGFARRLHTGWANTAARPCSPRWKSTAATLTPCVTGSNNWGC
jgi:sulfite reductase (NADPH) flavoprotein alpha-component